MKKDLDSKIVTGALIGGLVGVGAIAVYFMFRKKENSLEHIGKVISNVGEILSNHKIEELPVVKEFDKKLNHNEDAVGEVVNLVATAISLWKKFKN